MVHIISTSNNQHFIGKKKYILSDNNCFDFSNVFLINSSIRDDKKFTFSKPNFINNEKVTFSNFLYISKASDEIEKAYLALFDEKEESQDGNK